MTDRRSSGRGSGGVVMVCSQMPPVYGGAGEQAVRLGRALEAKGWKVTAITLDQLGVGSGVDRGIRFRRVLRGVAPVSLWTRLATTSGLGLVAFLHILTSRPAVVHIHGAYWWSIPPAIAGRLVRARVIVKTTRDGADDATSVYAKRIGPIKVGRLYGLTFRLADAIIVLNERARAIAAAEGLQERTHLIVNGVDEAKFARTAARRARAREHHGLAPNDRVVMFVGYLVKHKGIFDLLHAWREMGDRDAQLWLVGPLDGFHFNRDRASESEIPQLIDALIGEGYRVAKFGQVSSEELPELYWAADVFVLPSYVEGMPNSLAEALVAGCAIVATRIPGITDILGVHSPALLQPGDTAALSVKLARALDQPHPEPPGLVDRVLMSTVADSYDRLYKALCRR